MKMILTGATGFVGTNLIPYLDPIEYVIVPFSRKDEVEKFDFSNIEAVVHLAGKAHDLRNSTTPSEYYDVNYGLTKRLYDRFLESSAKVFIFISSVKAAADEVLGVLDENLVPSPATDYGKSKQQAEVYITSQTLPSGKSYYILRPCMIHGPGNKGNLNLLFKFVKSGIPYPLAAFQNQRSYLSITNLCYIIKQLLDKEAPSGIYNISDDQPLTTNEVIEILAQSVNRPSRLWKIPKRLIRLLATIGDTLKLPLNTERLEKLTGNYVVSNQKIKNVLNVDLPIDAIRGLEITAKSFSRTKPSSH